MTPTLRRAIEAVKRADSRHLSRYKRSTPETGWTTQPRDERLAARNGRPLSSAIVALGAVGLSADYSNNRAATAVTVPPVTTNR